MVGTRKTAAVTRLFPAQPRTAVRARVVERMHLVITVAIQNQGSAGNSARHKAAGSGHFGHVAQVQPAVIENQLAFELEDVLIGEGTPVHSEYAALRVINHIAGNRRPQFSIPESICNSCVHGAPCWRCTQFNFAAYAPRMGPALLACSRSAAGLFRKR